MRRIICRLLPAFIAMMALCTGCSGQPVYNVHYQTGAIPGIAGFAKLTAREIRLDTIMERHYQESLASMQDGSAFLKEVPEAERKTAIELQQARYQRYKDNRSRYNFQLMVNDKPDKDDLKDTDTLTTPCDCYLSGDTIRIKMGVWVFGGFAFSINLVKDRFSAAYWIDEHKQAIYKTQLTDKQLTDNITIANEAQSLVLDRQPLFSAGENLVGYLLFRTKHYYRTAEFAYGTAKDSYADQQMDTLYLRGSLHFKCHVRKKTALD